MGTQIGKYSVFQRITPLVKGFDTVLGFAILLLSIVGLLTIYSSGYGEGQRFLDHGRNLLIAECDFFNRGIATCFLCKSKSCN